MQRTAQPDATLHQLPDPYCLSLLIYYSHDHTSSIPSPCSVTRSSQKDTISKLLKASITIENGAYIRYFCHSTSQNAMETEITRQLFIPPYNPKRTPFLPQAFNIPNLPESEAPILDTTVLSTPQYTIAVKKEASNVTPLTPPQMIQYGNERYHQFGVNYSKRVTHNPPEDTLGWIDFICHNMMAETIRKVATSSKNSLGKSWEPVWIPYHSGVNSAAPLYFSTNYLTSR